MSKKEYPFEFAEFYYNNKAGLMIDFGLVASYLTTAFLLTTVDVKLAFYGDLKFYTACACVLPCMVTFIRSGVNISLKNRNGLVDEAIGIGSIAERDLNLTPVAKRLFRSNLTKVLGENV